MFGKLGDMMSKVNEMKQKVEQAKERLNGITVQGKSPNNTVTITANGNREIVNVEIHQTPPELNTTELETELKTAINQALKHAKNVEESEMQSATKGLLPNIPGLGF